MVDMPGGLSGILSSALVLPASVAGVLAALFVVIVVIACWRGSPRFLLPLGGLVIAVLAVLTVIDQVSHGQRAALRRDVLNREAELTRSALSPGSPLACLTAGAGEAVETACEKSVFASAQTVAGAVMYVGARLNLLTSASSEDDEGLKTALASTRRAVELDRFGLAAHVLATRDGCTADQCGAFDLVENASVLKANLKAQVFEQYVSRYAAGWNAPSPPAQPPPAAVSSIPTVPSVAVAAPPAGGAPVAAIKPGEPWDYPSADSIPAVSIMNAEPPAPKGADGKPQRPADKQSGERVPDAAAQADVSAPADKPADASAPSPPTPPKRPQQQAAPAAAR